MDSKNTPTNVIQFPGPKKEVAPPSAPNPNKPPGSKPKAKMKNLGASVLAVFLATIAVNRYVYQESNQTDLASGSGRGLASVERIAKVRDADWEMKLAERLATVKSRGVASEEIGRKPTMHERLRWGTLEEKYTIKYFDQTQLVESALLQDPTAEPAYVLDREKFLSEYGVILTPDFQSARLDSVQASSDKTVESYMLYDREGKATSEARFELDRFKRLISLKVQPVSI